MKKYYSLYEKLKRDIISGEYKAGEKLPSKRVMADITGYSQITVETAYGILEQEGYIIPKQRSGYFVCEINPLFSESESAVKREKLSEPKVDKSEPFEYSLWFKTVRKVIAERDKELFIKAPTEGCAVLRNAISDYLLRYRGISVEPRQIIIGSGAEQLYETAIKILGRDKIYGIENPSYKQIEMVYNQEGVRICRLDMGSDGIKSEELQTKEFNVLHVTPFNSYPSCVTASVKKRYEYLAWAKDNNSYVLEDDFASEFFIPGNPIETLYSLSGGKRVIYVNTFSKSLSASMRIGYMIIPKNLLSIYNNKLKGFACSVPVLDQYVLAEFINSGSFERHLNRIRRKMNKND